MTTQNLNKAKEYFYKKDYKKSLELFKQENNNYEAGLCCLLLKDIENARKFWEKDKKNSHASEWGLFILKIINLEKTSNIPKFFATRAFLEIYLNLFLENDLIEWAQNIISNVDIFAKSNPESYKFIARALYANGYFSFAQTLCKKSLRVFYCDPEAFLILSQCQFLLNDLPEALDSINKTLDIADDYYPAQIFRKIIKEKIEKKI